MLHPFPTTRILKNEWKKKVVIPIIRCGSLQGVSEVLRVKAASQPEGNHRLRSPHLPCRLILLLQNTQFSSTDFGSVRYAICWMAGGTCTCLAALRPPRSLSRLELCSGHCSWSAAAVLRLLSVTHGIRGQPLLFPSCRWVSSLLIAGHHCFSHELGTI